MQAATILPYIGSTFPLGCWACCCCLAMASAWMAFFLSLQRLFWNQTRITRGLRPVSSTKCSFRRASGRGLLAYTVRSVCSCCSESTVLTRGPLSVTLFLLRGLAETEFGLRQWLGLLLALLLDSVEGEQGVVGGGVILTKNKTDNYTQTEYHPPQQQKNIPTQGP